jgi:uncharacterized protein YndB with AHSA1/START domain
VVEPERLVMVDDSAADSLYEAAETTVTFTDLPGGRTEMVVHTTIQTTEEARGAAAARMASSLDRLGEQLA